MIRETISSATATSSAVVLVSAGLVGAVEPWKGVVLFIVSLVFGLMALAIIEED
jgi:hypothetical protein